MKPQTYTNIVLTVIAVALIGILLHQWNIIPSAQAARGDVQSVKIVEVDKYAFGRTSYDKAIVPVNVENATEIGHH